jgi:hypothetical protein
MPLFNQEEQEELKGDPLVAKLLAELGRNLKTALHRLRTAARSGQLDDCRKAEQRIADTEEFLAYFKEDKDG